MLFVSGNVSFRVPLAMNVEPTPTAHAQTFSPQPGQGTYAIALTKAGIHLPVSLTRSVYDSLVTSSGLLGPIFDRVSWIEQNAANTKRTPL